MICTRAAPRSQTPHYADFVGIVELSCERDARLSERGLDRSKSNQDLQRANLTARKGFNQFEHMMCNKLSDFTDKGFAEKILLDSFRKASKYPFTTGLSQWAEEKGLFPEETKFPFVLCLRPIDAIREKFAEFTGQIMASSNELTSNCGNISNIPKVAVIQTVELF